MARNRLKWRLADANPRTKRLPLPRPCLSQNPASPKPCLAQTTVTFGGGGQLAIYSTVHKSRHDPTTINSTLACTLFVCASIVARREPVLFSLSVLRPKNNFFSFHFSHTRFPRQKDRPNTKAPFPERESQLTAHFASSPLYTFLNNKMLTEPFSDHSLKPPKPPPPPKLLPLTDTRPIVFARASPPRARGPLPQPPKAAGASGRSRPARAAIRCKFRRRPHPFTLGDAHLSIRAVCGSASRRRRAIIIAIALPHYAYHSPSLPARRRPSGKYVQICSIQASICARASTSHRRRRHALRRTRPNHKHTAPETRRACRVRLPQQTVQRRRGPGRVQFV